MAQLSPRVWLLMFHDVARLKLRQLERCVNTIENTLQSQSRDLQRSLNARVMKMGSEERDQWYESYSDDFWELGEVFPDLLRKSLFVTSYAFIEHQLARLCEYLHQTRPQPVGPSDLRADGIERSRMYLKKVQNLPFPDQSPEWNALSDYRKIRNCLVHSGGHITSRAKKGIRELTRPRSRFAVDKSGRISLTHKACGDTLRTIDSFLGQLFAEATLDTWESHHDPR